MKYVSILLVLVILAGCVIERRHDTYRVYYHSGNAVSGTPPSDSKEYTSGEAVTLLGRGTLENNDYTFLGWEYYYNTLYPGDYITMRYEDINLYPVWDDGLDGPFIFEIESNEAVITAYTEYSYSGSTVIIPETLQGKSVTAIGNNAFSNVSVSGVTLPRNLKRIGIGAFSNNNITSLNIPSSVETIGVNAFRNNELRRIVFIPETALSEIAPYTFAYNSLTNITIPESISVIGTGAFHANELTEITIGTGVVIQDDTAMGVNGASFHTLYNTKEQAGGLYVYAGNDVWSYYPIE